MAFVQVTGGAATAEATLSPGCATDNAQLCCMHGLQQVPALTGCYAGCTSCSPATLVMAPTPQRRRRFRTASWWHHLEAAAPLGCLSHLQSPSARAVSRHMSDRERAFRGPVLAARARRVRSGGSLFWGSEPHSRPYSIPEIVCWGVTGQGHRGQQACEYLTR